MKSIMTTFSRPAVLSLSAVIATFTLPVNVEAASGGPCMRMTDKDSSTTRHTIALCERQHAEAAAKAPPSAPVQPPITPPAKAPETPPAKAPDTPVAPNPESAGGNAQAGNPDLAGDVSDGSFDEAASKDAGTDIAADDTSSEQAEEEEEASDDSASEETADAADDTSSEQAEEEEEASDDSASEETADAADDSASEGADNSEEGE